ncbi:hypothetical protein NDU88_008060 [Pleurodeles waltl]|uniref:Uncharacterized protein n=1 Tax=Pleurodeles waltl TaxID=8319 RepID=A0AAV7PS23_PLEWA|nr:hypothetical protein NDU88_008060 [Pleurodeles waltl]
MELWPRVGPRLTCAEGRVRLFSRSPLHWTRQGPSSSRCLSPLQRGSRRTFTREGLPWVGSHNSRRAVRSSGSRCDDEASPQGCLMHQPDTVDSMMIAIADFFTSNDTEDVSISTLWEMIKAVVQGEIFALFVTEYRQHANKRKGLYVQVQE